MGDYVKIPKKTGGVPEYHEDFRDRVPALVDTQGNINLDREFQEGKSDLMQNLTAMGFDPGRMDLSEYDYANMVRDWNAPMGVEVPDFYDPWEQQTYEYTRWALTDMVAGLYNRGVVSLVGGLAQLPAVVGAAITGGEEGGFWDSWINSVDSMEESARVQQSDKALEPLKFGNLNAHNLGYAIGDGLGFVADILLGSKGAGALSKAAVGSSKLLKAQRLGSFLTGTIQMQNDLYKDARDHGLSPTSASRMALSVGSIVALSEGAALEMIGLSVARPVSSSIARSTLKAEIKALGKTGGELSVQNFKAATNNFAHSFGTKMKMIGAKGFQGAAIEAGQEFSQQYIEEYGKQIFDTFFAPTDATIGKGKYGADVGSKDALQRALMGAFIGGIVGGTIGVGGSSLRGVQADTLHTYIDNAVQNKKPYKIRNLKNMVANKSNSIDNSKEVLNTIDKLVRFSQEVGGLNIKSNTAKLQLFQLMELEKQFQGEFGQKFKVSGKTHGLIANAFKKNEDAALQINQALQNEMQVVIDEKKKLGNDPVKFEEKLNKYTELFKKVTRNEIKHDTLLKELLKLESPAAKKMRVDRAVEHIKEQFEKEGVSLDDELRKMEEAKKSGKEFTYYDIGKGKKATAEAMDNIEKLNEEFEEAKQALEKGDPSKDHVFTDKLKKEYGMTVQEFENLTNVWSTENVNEAWKQGALTEIQTKGKEVSEVKEEATEETPEAVAEDKASKIEDLENQIKKQKEIVAKLGPEAKIGDNRGYEANLKLKELEKELKIEQIAQGRSAKTVNETTGFKHKKDQKFYDDNKETIEKRIKEIREAKKTVPKNKIQELTKQIEDQDSLTEGDLDAIQKEADEYKGEFSMEDKFDLSDAIAKRRENIKSLTEEIAPEGVNKEALAKQRKEAEEKAKKAKEDKKAEETKETKEDKEDEYIEFEEIEDEVDVNMKKLQDELSDIQKRLKGKLTGKQRDALINRRNKIQRSIEEIKGIQDKEYGTQEISAKEEAAIKKAAEKRRRGKDQQHPFIPLDWHETQYFERNRAKSNPELFNKLINHFQKLFPNIPINVIENALWKYGANTLGKINDLGIQINKDTAFQNTIVHEAGHMFVQVLGRDHPIIKAGLKFIKGTQYFKDAQALYPELSIEDQAEEALMEAVSENALEKLKTKFEGNKFQKFVAWLKKFWNSVKRSLGIVRGKQSVDMFADIIAYENTPINITTAGLDFDQRSEQHIMTVNSVLESISKARIDYMLDPTTFNPTIKNNLKTITYGDLAYRLLRERQEDNPYSKNIFDSISSEAVQQIEKASSENARAQKMYFTLATENTKIFELIETSINSLSRRSLPVIDNVEDLVLVSLKGDQKVSDSVRSLVTALIDDDGYLYDSDAVYQAIAKISDNSIDNNSFEKELINKSKEDPIVAKLKVVLDSFSSIEGVKQGIISELSSLTTIEYRSVIKERKTDKKGKVYTTMKSIIKNNDMTVNSIVESWVEQIKRSKVSDLKKIWNQIRKYHPNPHKNWKQGDNYFNRTKRLMEGLIGENISDEHWNEFLEKNDIKKTSLRNLFGSSWRIGEVLVDVNKGKTVLSNYLKTLAQLKQGDTLASNFVNQSGNNVSSTRLGYWINQFNKMFKLDNSFQNDYKNSPVYKDNPFIKMWAKEKGLAKWFIHDAFENIGMKKPIENSNAEISDTILNNLNYYAISGSKTHYYQSVGVTSDRTHLTYFRAPKYNDKQLKEQYNERAKLDKELIRKEFSKNEKSFKEILNQYNNISLMWATGSSMADLKIETPFQSEKTKKELIGRVEDVYDLVKKANLSDALTEEKNLKKLIQDYILTERLNRSYLEDVYAGPAIRRKTLSDVMKRMGGMNSGGKLIGIDKPVHVFVLDTNNISDSFSFNGSHLQNRISQMSGPTDLVGINVKDMLYQVDQNGDLDYYKMSTLGVTGEVNKNSLSKFAFQNDLSNPNNYNNIGNAILRLEELIKEQTGEENPYIKIIDRDVVKGDLTQYTIVTLDDLVNKTEEVSKKGTKKDFKNYRVAFNLNKDFSKVELSKQDVTLSTQLSKILLNFGVTQEQIVDFENSLVNVLNNSLEQKDRYGNNLYNRLNKVNLLLDQLTKNSEENTKSELIDLLTEIKKFNSAEYKQVYNIGNYTYTINQLENLATLMTMQEKVGTALTNEEFIERLEKNDLTEAKYKNLIDNNALEDFNNKKLQPETTEMRVKNRAKNPIESFDNPNLKNIVEQFISSRLTKAGVRVQIAGIYAHMIPNYGNDLKGYKNNEGPMEIAVPWSMFVQKRENETDEEAFERANEMLRDPENADKFKTVVVRVPASGPVSKFAGKVKYFIDGKSNTAIVPDEFVQKADADHDGDKVFVYRAELNKDGEIVDGDKTNAFNQVFERANSQEMREATEDNLKLSKIRESLEKLGLPVDAFSLRNDKDFAQLANNMSFGQDAIGIWAIGSKMLSVLSQSKEELKSPLLFSFKNNELSESNEYKKFTNKSLGDVARFLQAALDMGKDPIHISTGVNKHTIQIATTLSLLGVEVEEIMGFLRHPKIENLVEGIQKEYNNYADDKFFSVKNFIEEKRAEIDAKKSNYSSNQVLGIINKNQGRFTFTKGPIADGVYKTKNETDPLYFEVTTVKQNDNGSIEKAFRVVDQSKLKGKEDLTIIEKFQEIDEIAKSIQKIIPLLQLDNTLPNNGFDTRKILEIFSDLNKEDAFKFTTENLANRPLLKHYRQVLNQQSEIYKSKFYIENSGFYNIAKELAADIFGERSAFREKEIFEALKESMYMYDAQKTHIHNIDSPAVFVKNFTNMMVNILSNLNDNNSSIKISKPFGMDENTYIGQVNDINEAMEKDAVEGTDLLQRELDLIKEKGKTDEVWREFYKNYKNSLEYKEMSIALSDNIFIKNLIATDNFNTGDYVINPKKEINNISVSNLKHIKDSFQELPPQIQEQIKAYAMMRFGIASKMNSISKMFPTAITMSVLKKGTKLLKYADSWMESDERKDMAKTNAAIAFKKNLPMPSMNEIVDDPGNLKFNEYIDAKFGKMVKTFSDYVLIKDMVYKRSEDESLLFVPVSGFGAVIGGDIYTHYILDEANMNRSLENITKTAIELRNEC